jgi:hypothetical protein
MTGSLVYEKLLVRLPFKELVVSSGYIEPTRSPVRVNPV